MTFHRSITEEIFRKDIISVVGIHLDDLDLVAFCIAHVQSQVIFRHRLSTMATLTTPLYKMHISTAMRMLQLMRISATTNLSIIYKIPKTLHICGKDFVVTLQRLQSTVPKNEVFNIAWIAIYSAVAKLCPNISELIVNTLHLNRHSCSKQSHCFQSGQCPRRNICCNFGLTSLLNAIPVLPSIKKLQIHASSSIAVQKSISRIIGSASIEELKYMCDSFALIQADLCETIQRMNSLKQLTVLGNQHSLSPVQMIFSLLSFPTVSLIETDDTGCKLTGSPHVLEYLAGIDCPNLTALRYDAIHFMRLMRLQRRIQFKAITGPLTNQHLPTDTSYLDLDHSLIMINCFKAYPALTYVDLNNCVFFDDNILYNIWKGLPNLAVLRITHSTKLYGGGLNESPGIGWTKLKQLDLSTCRLLTANCIKTIAATTKANDVGLIFRADIASRSEQLKTDLASLGYHISQHNRCIATEIHYYKGCEDKIYDEEGPRIYPYTQYN